MYEPSQIARLYLKTWFPIDAVSCLPVNYLIYIPGLSGAGAASGAKTLRLLRLLRLLKLLRLARLNRLIARYQEEFYALMTSCHAGPIVPKLLVVFCCSLLAHGWGRAFGRARALLPLPPSAQLPVSHQRDRAMHASGLHASVLRGTQL